MHLLNRRSAEGFTLIEILVVIGMIAILASIVIIAINPLRQFAQARNAQRASDVNAVLNAIGERLAENKGIFTDTNTCANAIPNTPQLIGSAGTQYNLRTCLIPNFISELPVDPVSGHNTCMSTTCAGPGENYDAAYTIAQDASTGRITVCAPHAAEPA